MTGSVRKTLLSGFAGLGLLFGAGGVSADVTYTFGLGNAALSGYPTPFGQVVVSLIDAHDAKLTYSTFSQGVYTYMMGDGGAMAAQVNAASFTSSTPTVLTQLPGFSSPTFAQGSGGEDGFGTFNLKWNAATGYPSAFTSASFTLHDNDSAGWASAATVLALNGAGFPAAIHVFVCDTSLGACSPSITAAATGFATVPIPAAAWLFVSGLMGLIGIARRKLTA